MPEGDTILRTAENLGRWLQGRVVTRAESRVPGADLGPVVGATVDRVEARAKHLLMHFSSGHVLHTHMRMTGSWHVYRAGDRWRAPNWHARVILECGERIAVCFRAPVVEVLDERDQTTHGALAALGPDVLAADFDVAEVVRRARTRPPATTIGELLLDQQVVSGIGNVYRCEALFATEMDPHRPVADVDDDGLRRVVERASRLMRRNVAGGTTMDRRFEGGYANPSVYRRAGQRCVRCGERVKRAELGTPARTIYWCPGCQAADQPASS